MDQKTPEQKTRSFAFMMMRYLELSYVTAYTRRELFQKKNVSHLTSAVNSTKLDIDKQLAQFDLNSMEELIVSQMQNLLSECKNSSQPCDGIIGINTFNILIDRSDNFEQVYRKGCDYMLAALGQMSYQATDIVFPRISVRSYKGENKLQAQYLNSTVGCDFKANIPTTPNSVWDRIYRSAILSQTITPIGAVCDLMMYTYIDILPCLANKVGLTRFPIDKLGKMAQVHTMEGNGHYHYIGSGLLTLLKTNNRVVPSLDELLGRVSSRTLQLAKASLEADEDELEDEEEDTDDPATDDAGDTDDDPATDDAGDDTDDSDVDDDSSDEDATDENNPDDPDAGDDNDQQTPKLLKLDIQLPKDETLDDILYKVSVANFIRDAKERNVRVSTTTLKALIKWKNLFLFLVSAQETKKFLSRLKQKLS